MYTYDLYKFKIFFFNQTNAQPMSQQALVSTTFLLQDLKVNQESMETYCFKKKF